jgi:[acyl-carrier-protein] S-malonyltransferase
MQPAAEAMDEALGRTPPGPFRLTLYANVTAGPVTDPATERDLLVQQVTGRVRWRESVIAMKAAGIERFVELGGKVVGPMIGRTVEDVTVMNAITMADIEVLMKEI